MAKIYPSEYPFHLDAEGWPEPVYAPPYPFEYYYDNGRRSLQRIQSTTDGNFKRSLAIRRHTPGSTEPNPPQISSRTLSPTTNSQVIAKKNRPQTKNSRSISVTNHVSPSTDPDERPIKPMRDTSVYNQKSVQKRTLPPRRPKPIPPSPRYESDSYRLPSSRIPANTIRARRPIRIDLIPKTPFGIPSRPNPPRRVIVEEYNDDGDDPVAYLKYKPKKILSYQEVSGMTTREWENYQMSKPRRVVRVRSPPVETIIYRT